MKSEGIISNDSFSTSQVSENLGKLYSEMIFVHGFVHCDPHPGNILVQKCPSSQKSQIVLLDHGLYQVQNLQASYTKKIPFVLILQTIFHAAVWGFEPEEQQTHIIKHKHVHGTFLPDYSRIKAF